VSDQTTPAAPEADSTESADQTTAEAAAESSGGKSGPSDGPEDSGSQDSGSQDSGEQSESEGRPSRMNRLEQEGDIAADYLEDLLDIADLDGDLDMDVEGDRAAVSIVGADLNQLVGRNGEVLEALQELTRLAVYRETGERSRLMLDISGYRADKRATLEKLATDIVGQVKESGDSVSLEPMTPFERKVVHDVVAAAGLISESEGEEPRRFVVVLPKR
jgi:spoIIIJ-associated protein